MSGNEFGWEPLLRSDAPEGAVLKAGLFTTYDRADERFLVEHLLPLLLNLSHDPEAEGIDRQYFLVELDQRLKQLHDRLFVVSSTIREEPSEIEYRELNAYSWIWRSIRHLTVGSCGRAIQHAKLWLLHWGAVPGDANEYMEIVVSSANLTRAALRGQIQSVWRACIKLEPRRSEDRLRNWGILPDFLRELARQSGQWDRLELFVDLLARAECPEGVTFVASVPGTHSLQTLRSTPWGAAGLRRITPLGRGAVSVTVMCPFVGAWGDSALRTWCDSFEGVPERLQLIWIKRHHPWAEHGRWSLSPATLKTLKITGSMVLELRHERTDPYKIDRLHQEHLPEDERWYHGKLYHFSLGSSRRLLLTSANFSMAAWGQPGNNSLRIENFELGACIDQAVWPLTDMVPLDDYVHLGAVAELETKEASLITWADASWDGVRVRVNCRCESGGIVTALILSSTNEARIEKWVIEEAGQVRTAEVAWSDSSNSPSEVELSCAHESLSIPVFDSRTFQEREDSLPAGVDEDLFQMMRDRLLFEQYGGRAEADSDWVNIGIQDSASTDKEDFGHGTEPAADYSVPEIVMARRHLAIVDNWAAKIDETGHPKGNEFEMEVLRRDGELLLQAYLRQIERDRRKGAASAFGAELATEELQVRLKLLGNGNVAN